VIVSWSNEEDTVREIFSLLAPFEAENTDLAPIVGLFSRDAGYIAISSDAGGGVMQSVFLLDAVLPVEELESAESAGAAFKVDAFKARGNGRVDLSRDSLPSFGVVIVSSGAKARS